MPLAGATLRVAFLAISRTCNIESIAQQQPAISQCYYLGSLQT